MKIRALNRSNLERLPSAPLARRAQFSQPQTGIVSEARMRAIDAASAAMIHRLDGPITALLRYLHEIKRQTERSTAIEANQTLIGEVTRRALRETERVQDVMAWINRALEVPADAAAVAHERAPVNGHDSRDAVRFGPRLLTPREREVLALISGGASNNAGGLLLGISTRTFEAHRAHIMAKLGVRNAADLIRVGRRQAQ